MEGLSGESPFLFSYVNSEGHVFKKHNYLNICTVTNLHVQKQGCMEDGN